jgi:hypothetical protein
MHAFIHKTTVVYLAGIILLRMMAMPLSLLDYSLNRNYIASSLCENKSKTEMHCAGKCFLNKQLEKSNENQNNRDQKGSAKILIIDFFEPFDEILSGNHFVVAILKSSCPVQHLSNAFTAGIFHPPLA